MYSKHTKLKINLLISHFLGTIFNNFKSHLDLFNENIILITVY